MVTHHPSQCTLDLVSIHFQIPSTHLLVGHSSSSSPLGSGEREREREKERERAVCQKAKHTPTHKRKGSVDSLKRAHTHTHISRVRIGLFIAIFIFICPTVTTLPTCLVPLKFFFFGLLSEQFYRTYLVFFFAFFGLASRCSTLLFRRASTQPFLVLNIRDVLLHSRKKKRKNTTTTHTYIYIYIHTHTHTHI